MTFLELQKKIVQTRKARRGVKNRMDYFGEDFATEKAYKAVYHKALNAANKVVEHCFDVGEIENFSIVWGNQKKEKSADDKKYLEVEKKCKELAEQNLELAKQLKQLESKLAKYKRGGRKDDKEKEMAIVTYKTNSPAATVREIAAALKVSTRTVQKILVKHGMNGRNYNVSRK